MGLKKFLYVLSLLELISSHLGQCVLGELKAYNLQIAVVNIGKNKPLVELIATFQFGILPVIV